MKTSGFHGCCAPGTSSLTCSRLFFHSLLATLVLALAGCAAAPVAHEEEAHELPTHHPRSFRRAIDAIEARAPAAASGTDAAARRELADIVRWLPMLAADTELGRADWDRVRGITLAFAAELEAAGDAAGDEPGFTAHAREAVAALRGIAAGLPADPPDAPEDAP